MAEIRGRTTVNVPEPGGRGYRIVGFRIRDEGGLSHQIEAFDKILRLDGDRRYAAGLEAAAQEAEKHPYGVGPYVAKAIRALGKEAN